VYDSEYEITITVIATILPSHTRSRFRRRGVKEELEYIGSSIGKCIAVSDLQISSVSKSHALVLISY
jgi:hypothetical protein